MATNNTILVLDIAMAAMQTAARANEMLMRAQMEGRDIGADELLKLTQETNDLHTKWKQEIGG